MTCVTCHNPHTTSLKIVGAEQSDPSQLCKNCHPDLAQSYEHSIHQKIKVACIDCHIGSSKGNDDFHQVPDHDFKAKIEACNKCHTDQMHSQEALNSHKPASVSVTAQSTIVASGERDKKSTPSSAGLIAVVVLCGVVSGGVLRRTIFKQRS